MMYMFARAKFHRLGALYKRNPYSSSEGWKPKMKKLAGLFLPRPLVGIRLPPPLCMSRVSLCSNLLFLEGQHQAGLEPTP